MKRPQYVQEAISIDEVGIRSGHYGPFILQSSYQPIFDFEKGKLIPTAVEGLIKVRCGSEYIAAIDFFKSITKEDRLFVETMCRALHVQNYRHIGVDGIDLYFNVNPTANTDLEDSVEQVRIMMDRLDSNGVSPENLVCEITESNAIDSGTLRGIVKEFRRHGIRIAVDDYGTEYSNIERVESISPDIIKFDGGWFRNLSAIPEAQRLITSMVRSFKRTGIKVLIEGVESPVQLEAAIKAGADQVQGFLLAQPELAGCDVELVPLEIDPLMRSSSNVVPLRRLG